MSPPIIKQIDGDYSYEKYKNCLIWRISSIDQSNSSGSLEFSVGGHASDFFPVNVNFNSKKSYCDIQVSLNLFSLNSCFDFRFLLNFYSNN